MEPKNEKVERVGRQLSRKVQMGLKRLCQLLQWQNSRLGLRKLRALLVSGVLLSSACCIYVVWHSLQPFGRQPWQVAPIKAFPLPPPTREPKIENFDSHYEHFKGQTKKILDNKKTDNGEGTKNKE